MPNYPIIKAQPSNNFFKYPIYVLQAALLLVNTHVEHTTKKKRQRIRNAFV